MCTVWYVCACVYVCGLLSQPCVCVFLSIYMYVLRPITYLYRNGTLERVDSVSERASEKERMSGAPAGFWACGVHGRLCPPPLPLVVIVLFVFETT